MYICAVKYFIAIIICFTVFKTSAQELAIQGGVKSNFGWIGAIKYNANFSNLQLSLVGELRKHESHFFAYRRSGEDYTALGVGLDLNFRSEFKSGYVYPGLVLRHVSGDDGVLNYRGLEFGVQAGVLLKVADALGLSLESGFRVTNMRYTSRGNYTNNVSGNSNEAYIPLQVGLRFVF